MVLTGDVINDESLLEALAEPCGIFVSSVVHEQVHCSLDVGFADIGEQQVKNIMRPLRVYQVMLAGAGTQATVVDHAPPSRVSPRRRWWAVGAVLGLASIVAASLLLPLIKSSPMPANSPPPLSLAILPFA